MLRSMTHYTHSIILLGLNEIYVWFLLPTYPIFLTLR